MKKPSCVGLSALLISFLPAATALLGASWSVTNVPFAGLTDIRFPLTIVEADHISGYYFAQQFTFVNSGLGYTGLQPRPDVNGATVLHGVFSSFIAGTQTNDPNCHLGADGGPGVSCSVQWSGSSIGNRTYHLEVKSDDLRLWVGTAIDTVTGARMHIGSWTTPSHAGGIQNNQLGFVEWYPWNSWKPPNHCANLPYQRTIFGTPITSRPGCVGTQGDFFEYGDCVGLVAFQAQPVAGGVQNNCGFRGKVGLYENGYLE
ncbi:hypothetical protein B0H16DRAFT_1604594 [Mycena metata]|uniref:Uncharacterized protein n=1 Tax=Mycena metata TaxID=1033252 RepID=A0AAD7HHK0_9AGAR|nr:hypothetical protein B0H16DRAFT_1604594 [Mycena metata]